MTLDGGRPSASPDRSGGVLHRLWLRVFALVVVAVVLFATFGLWVLHTSYAKARRTATEDVQRTAKLAAALGGSTLTTGLRELVVAAQGAPFLAGSPSEISAYLNRINPLTLGFSGGAGWADTSGQLQVSTSSPDSVPVDVSDRDYVQQGLADKLYVSAAITARIVKAPVLALSVPTHDVDGKVNGVLVGSVRLDTISAQAVLQLFGSSDVSVLDRDRQQIFGVDGKIVLGATPPPAVVANLTGRTTAYEGEGLGGKQDQIVAVATVEVADWIVVAQRPASDVFAVARDQYTRSLTVLGVVAVLVLAAGFAVSRRLDRFHRRVLEGEAMLGSILEQLPIGVLVTAPSGEVVISNRQSTALLGQPDADSSAFDRVATLPPVVQVLGGGRSVRTHDVQFEGATGESRILSVNAAPIITRGRVSAAVTVFEDVTDRRSEEGRTTGLAAATTDLAAASTESTVIDVAMTASLEVFGAGSAAVLLRDPVARRLTVAPESRDPDAVDVDLSEPSLEAQAVSAGASRVDAGVDGTVVVLPLHSTTGVEAVLRLRFPAAAVADGALRQLAGFASVVAEALNRVRSQQRDHQIAVVLQRSLLGSLPTQVEGMRTAFRYLPAEDHLEVGGDFFDLRETEDGATWLVIGDIVGHGIDAAASMGQLRIAIRALMPSYPSPAKLLEQLDLLVDVTPGSRFATTAVVRIDRSGSLLYSCAGHPPPVLRNAGRTVLLDEATSPPLGVRSDRPRADSRVDLADGETVVCLYTDGLVERRTVPIDQLIDQLVGLIDSNSSADPEPLIDTVIAELMADAPQRDDVAVVIAMAQRP